MTAQANFSRVEWDLLLGAPALVALVVIHAEPCGPWMVYRKLLAVGAAIAERPGPRSQGELVQAVRDAVRAGQSPLWPVEYPPDLGAPYQWALDGCRKVAAILAQKASEAEADGYARWLLDIGRRVATAPGERGPRGEPQQAALELLAETLGAPLEAP